MLPVWIFFWNQNSPIEFKLNYGENGFIHLIEWFLQFQSRNVGLFQNREKSKHEGCWYSLLNLEPLHCTGHFKLITFSLGSWKFQIKQSFSPENFTKLSYTPWKSKDQKPRPMKIPHDFVLITPENSSYLFLLTPGISTFSSSLPLEIPCHKPFAPCLDFFWNSPFSILDVKQLYVRPKIGNSKKHQEKHGKYPRNQEKLSEVWWNLFDIQVIHVCNTRFKNLRFNLRTILLFVHRSLILFHLT